VCWIVTSVSGESAASFFREEEFVCFLRYKLSVSLKDSLKGYTNFRHLVSVFSAVKQKAVQPRALAFT